MVQDEEAKGTVRVVNAGGTPLTIARVEPSRFCSAVVPAQPILPGSSTEVGVTCRSDLYGPLREQLTIRATDPRAGTTKVELVADVVPLLAFDRPLIDLTMPFGEERTEDVHLVGKLLEQAKVRLAQPAVADVDLIPARRDDGRIVGYRVHCRGRKVGTNAGNLIVATGLARPEQVAIPYACKVTGTLEVSPTTPYFNLKVSGPKVVWIDVSSTQAGFEVQAVHVIEGPFTASFEHGDQAAHYRVKVTALDQRIGDEERSASGKLLILSNDRTEPRKELPLFGFGRVNRVERPPEP